MGVKISALPAIAVPALTDVFPVVQGGVTYKETMTQLKSLFNLPLITGPINTLLRSDGTNYVASTATTLSSTDVLSGLTEANAGNIKLTANTMSSTNTNGNINFIPSGTGVSIFNSTIQSDDNAPLQVVKIAAGCEVVAATYASANLASAFYGYASANNTGSGFDAVVTGRLLTRFAGFGSDGTQFTPAGIMDVVCDGAVSNGVVPGRIEFKTYNAAGAQILAATINKSQILTLTNPLPTGSGGTGLATAGAAGTILRSNATNFVNSTSTFADTYGASTLLYSNGANTVAGLATANNGLLVTSATGVPSIGNVILADIAVNSVNVGRGGGSVATNTRIGTNALSVNTSGLGNTALGSAALGANITNSASTAVGTSAGALSTADYQTLIGYLTGSTLTTGGLNTFVGGNAGQANSIGADITTGSSNTLIGQGATADAADAIGVLGLGRTARPDKATGATSANAGPGIAIGSATYPVGFRGDATIYPTAGVGAGALPVTFSGYWRIKINGTYYKVPLYPDA